MGGVILLLTVLAGAWSRGPQHRGPDTPLMPEKELRGRITAVLRWKAFWDGIDSFHPRYIAGAPVTAKVLYNSDWTAVFISEVGVNLLFRPVRPEGAFQVSFLSSTTGETNQLAASRFIQEQARGSRDADCVAVSSAGSGGAQPTQRQAGNVVPGKRLCPEQVPGFAGRATWQEQDIAIVLPSPEPLATIGPRPPGSEIASVRMGVTEAARSYLGQECPAVALTIPLFSVQDPQVYVLADFGPRCGRGAFVMKRGIDGRWDAGKLWIERSPGELGALLGRIEKRALVTFRVP